MKQNFKSIAIARIFIYFLAIFIFISCGVSRNRILIDDYYIVPNGMQISGSDPLHVFIFENDQTIVSFQQFISNKFNSNSYFDREFNVMIDGNNYKLKVYSKDEFNKYVDSNHFIVSNLTPSNSRIGDQADFTGISVINDYNEDCLKEGSLFELVVIKYLQKLKEEYLSNARK